MSQDKPGIQENKQSALDDKTTYSDRPISSGNSMLHKSFFFFYNSFIYHLFYRFIDDFHFVLRTLESLFACLVLFHVRHHIR